MQLSFPLLRYCGHALIIAFALGFALGLIDNAASLDPLPHSFLDKILAVLYSSAVYGLAFACLGLLLALLLLIFWRRPLHDPAACQRGAFFLLTLLSAIFLFTHIGMWYYRDASFKVSLTEYVRGGEILLIVFVSLGGGMLTSLGVRWFSPFLWRLRAPAAVLTLLAMGSWFFSLVGPIVQYPASAESSLPSRVKIALIGIDAASWNFLLPWISQGKLPHLQRLMEEGAWGVLRSRHPTRSPAIWTGIVTGKKRAKHRIYDFSHHQENGMLIPSGSHHRRAKALWNILSENQRSVWIIDWMTTYPPEKVDGVIVTNLLENQDVSTYNQPDSVYPVELKPVIDQLTSPYRPASSHYPTSRFTDARYAQLEQKYLSELEVVEQVALYGCHQTWDLFALYTHSTDAVLHHFWKFMEPERFRDPIYNLTPENISRFGGTALQHFQRTDEMLGRVLDCLDDDTIVIVVSDHGQQGRSHKPDRLDDHTSGHHHNDGIFIIKGPGIREGILVAQKTVDTPLIEIGKMLNDKILSLDIDRVLRNLHLLDYVDVVDITPTILYLLGLPVAEDMDGRIMTGSIKETHLAQNPVRYVQTYENGEFSASSPASAPFSQEMEERLRSLGYIQ